jgi:hypothetical protein
MAEGARPPLASRLGDAAAALEEAPEYEYLK